MVAQLQLATTKKGFTTKEGKTIPDHTEWHNIVLTNGLAKIASQYIKKGDKLYIEGELRTRSYDDKNGVKHFITEVYGDKLELLTPKQNNVQQNAPAPNLDNVPF
jgi:single-strand DNA-binding protein